MPVIVLSALTVTGVGAAVASRDDPTYFSIWVGVKSTAFAAALVDASARSLRLGVGRLRLSASSGGAYGKPGRWCSGRSGRSSWA